MTYKNVTIIETPEHVHVKIHKKYEPSLYAFLLFAFVFIGVVLFYLIPYAKENNPESENNVLIIVQLLFYTVGGIMFIGAVHEFLKREWIEINQHELKLGYTILGHRISETRYVLKNIHETTLAPNPIRGWQTEEDYKDAARWKRSYSNDIRKVFPTLRFQYKGKEVLFANGLTPNDRQEVIAIIKKHIANSK